MDIHTQLVANHDRRLAQEARFVARMERRWDAAQDMIGKLMRGGQVVFYVYPPGGKYREGSRGALVDFLVRNRYV